MYAVQPFSFGYGHIITLIDIVLAVNFPIRNAFFCLLLFFLIVDIVAAAAAKAVVFVLLLFLLSVVHIKWLDNVISLKFIVI